MVTDLNFVHTGDSLEVLDTFEANSVHAVVTDPPYGLAFMGRDWDTFNPKEYQEWCESWASKAKRVLRPGGHLLAFSGNRTHHRLFSGVEDAGFEIRDTLTWHYGSGFPKALDVSKAIDKAEGAEREVVGERTTPDGEPYSNRKKYDGNAGEHEGYDRPWKKDPDKVDNHNKLTAPATEPAKKWDGWKTALKPATEFVVLARKPLAEGTVAENVQEWGTGALNIDGTRINAEERPNVKRDVSGDTGNTWGGGVDGTLHGSEATGTTTEGRYPANVVFDEEAADALDAEVGELAGGAHTPASDERNVYSNGDAPSSPDTRQQLESGGPSRYFYTSKATKAERTLDGRIENAHPTVKPTDLMEWLVKLATAEGQTVLDPFAGTGTTLKTAKNLNREFIGIEKDPKWADVARVRVGLTPEDPSVVRSDDDQAGMEAFTD